MLQARETSLRVGIENLIMLEKGHYSGNGCGLNAINQFLVLVYNAHPKLNIDIFYVH